MSKARFPTSAGWLHMKLEMKTSTPRSEADIKTMVLMGRSPEAVEFGLVEQHGKKIKVVMRDRKTETA